MGLAFMFIKYSQNKVVVCIFFCVNILVLCLYLYILYKNNHILIQVMDPILPVQIVLQIHSLVYLNFFSYFLIATFRAYGSFMPFTLFLEDVDHVNVSND